MLPSTVWAEASRCSSPVAQGAGWGDQGRVPRGSLAAGPPVWEEEGLSVPNQEGAAVALLWLALTWSVSFEAVRSCAACN